MISQIITAYICLTLLVAVWLGWTMYAKHEQFDWQYRSGDLWISFFMGVIVWPVVILLKPGLLLGGRSWFDISENTEGIDLTSSWVRRMRKLHNITQAPPKCGNNIAYKHRNMYHDDVGDSTVVFDARDIEIVFKGKELPFHYSEEAAALVALIKSRDENWPEVTPIPEDINFERMALMLIKQGFGETACAECMKTYSSKQLLSSIPATMKPGWNFGVYSCPKGHKLLVYKYRHLSVKRTTFEPKPNHSS